MKRTVDARAKTLPLFATCTDCGEIRPVKKPSQQTSRRCRGCAGTRHLATTNHIETGRLGGLESGRRRRAAMLKKLATLTPFEAYRKGRVDGWHAGARAARRRYGVHADAPIRLYHGGQGGAR